MAGNKKAPSVTEQLVTLADTVSSPSPLHTLGAPRHSFPELEGHGQLLQGPTRCSHSAIWQLMQDFYENSSINAWNEVPFYVTCSANVADAYSDFILGFWLDLPKDMPLHVVELSTGSGRLSFMLLKMLSEKIQRYPQLSGRKFRYVMTDCAEGNIEFWMKHPNFQPFIQMGLLDFARLNPLFDKTIHLKISDTDLSDTAIVGIANYCFDTLPNDYFQVRAGVLHEALVELTLNLESGGDELKPLPETVTRAFVSPHVTYEKADTDYYPYPLWNAILAEQEKHYYNASFFFPAGGLGALELLKHVSNGEMMLLSSDKGYIKKEFNIGLDELEYAPHGGAFSVMVNYDIVLDWFKRQEGTTTSSINDNSFAMETVVCTLGQSPKGQLQQMTYWHLERMNSMMSAYELITAARSFTAGTTDYENRSRVQQLLSAMRLSLADPFVVSEVAPTLCQIASNIGMFTRKDLIRLLSRAWELYYPFPGEHNLAYKLSVLFLCLNDYEKSLKFGQIAEKLYPADGRLYSIMGRAHEHLHHYEQAMEYYVKSLQLDPESELAAERLSYLVLLVEQTPETEETLFKTLIDYDANLLLAPKEETANLVT